MCSVFCPVVSHRAIIYMLLDVTGKTNHADTPGSQSSMKTQPWINDVCEKTCSGRILRVIILLFSTETIMFYTPKMLLD